MPTTYPTFEQEAVEWQRLSGYFAFLNEDSPQASVPLEHMVEASRVALRADVRAFPFSVM